MGLLIRRTAGGPWTPADLGSQRFWIDADQLGLANNDPVAQWDDEFGSYNYHFLQGLTANKPTFKTGVKFGRPAVYFDGGDNMQTANTSDMNNVSGDMVFWCVYKFNSFQPALSAVFDKSDDATAAGTKFQLTNWNGYDATYWQSGVGTSSIILEDASSEDTNWHYATVARTGSTWTYREDAALHESGTLAGNINDCLYKPTIGSLSNGAWKMSGYIAEMGLIAEYEDPTTNLEPYLATKWGI